MDSTTESAFLMLMDEQKEIMTSKANTKESRQSRNAAWDCVAQQLLVNTGKDYSVVQLQKKWNNAQQRLKEKARDGKKTGGGPAAVFTENDRLTLRILGENNPKVAMVPGAMANTSSLASVSLAPEKEDEATVRRGDCASTPKRCKRDDLSIEDLHREVLLLQKQKLLLRISALQRDQVVCVDKGTQTESFVYRGMLMDE